MPPMLPTPITPVFISPSSTPYRSYALSPLVVTFVLLGAANREEHTATFQRAHPTCTASIDTDPPSTPSTGNVSGSDEARVPST